ncbi:hypothetical protein [Chitinophaga rhizophila]|uniref:Uncharacterized protein n=1 Tax=Chitinophaga rhizophila TaxID=2866212 RepID=A0ABS7GBA3_9BACT|nr:hypothetical protein [Chitinophaga rhizophila]MBW8684696.1 hypothetical protein [Chitinophaga rhizophila]
MKSFFSIILVLTFVSIGFCQSSSSSPLDQTPLYKIHRIDSVESVYLIYAQRDGQIMKIASVKDSLSIGETIVLGKYYKLRLSSYLDESKVAGKLHIHGIMINEVLIELEGGKVTWDLFSCINLKGLSIND